jgi:hypothetical protein
MRRSLIFAFVLVPAAAIGVYAAFASSSSTAVAQSAPPPAARACDHRCGKWMDASLRIDQLQVVGTADSTKQRPDHAMMMLIRMGGEKDAQALDYGEPALAAQLDGDVRALSFDVAFDPKGGAYKSPAGASMAMDLLPDDYAAAMSKPGFKVIHVIDIDYNSSCLALADCLKQVADWSRAHPRHLPIVITLRTNDAKTPMPGATTPVAFDAAALDALDGEIRAAFNADEIITPDQVQGRHATLREAVLAHAWPKVGEARGKVIFVLDDNSDKARAYQGARKSLEGRSMFLATDPASPAAAFVALPDPVKDQARIAAAVRDGFMVITRADADTREARLFNVKRRDAAFASGAQIVMTDFATADPKIGPYRVSLADNPDALCGAALASEHCVRLENPELRTAAAN